MLKARLFNAYTYINDYTYIFDNRRRKLPGDVNFFRGVLPPGSRRRFDMNTIKRTF